MNTKTLLMLLLCGVCLACNAPQQDGKKTQYWSIAHGTAPGEVVRDEEGMQTMRQLGLNMAFMIKSIRLGLQQNDIRFLFPGYYSGDNLETLQRVTDIKNMCREILDGERKPTVSNGNNGGMDMMVDDKGVRINFSSHSGMK